MALESENIREGKVMGADGHYSQSSEILYSEYSFTVSQ
jgi:hypothetical protein